MISLDRAFDMALNILTNPVAYAVLIFIPLLYFCYGGVSFVKFLIMFVLLAPVVGLVAYGVANIYENEKRENQKWASWAKEHCKVVEKRQGNLSLDSGVGISSSGKPVVGTITSSTPDQTSYQCDDGVTYIRNE